MFERTTSLWRRLTHQSAGTTVEEMTTENERRIWVRHPCDLQTQYAPDADELPLVARVLDVSRGGAKLLVGQSHEPGSLISIELPRADGQTSFAALACVVHEAKIHTAEWVLGCSFSRELETEQLQAFGLDQHARGGIEQRNYPRFTAPVTATVQLTNSLDSARWPANVLNLSAGGIALLVPQEIRNGTLLTLDLASPNGHAVETILICVVHMTLHEDGSRRLGCNFIRELEESDLRKLLA